MCGGRGTRLSRGEKPLVEVRGTAMIDRVLDAISPVVNTVYAVPSSHTPETRAHLDGRVPIIETPGMGYVEDLSAVLDTVKTPILTVTADLPLLQPADVRTAVEVHGNGSLTVCVPVERKHALGVSVETSFDHEGKQVAPTGLNVVGDGSEEICVLNRVGFAVNVNRCRDLWVSNIVTSELF